MTWVIHFDTTSSSVSLDRQFEIRVALFAFCSPWKGGIKSDLTSQAILQHPQRVVYVE